MVEFGLTKSPFAFERNYHAKSISKSFRLPEDVYNEIMKYYDSKYGEENNLTKAFRSITLEKLDSICRERKTYQDLNLLMLIPKTDDIDMLNENSEVIAFFTSEDINNINQDLLKHDYSEDDILIKVDLSNYTHLEKVYHISKNLNPNCFKFDISNISSFDDFKIRLNKAYPKIDVSNSYIVPLMINNYLDIYRDGEFQSDTYNNTHEGIYIFVDYGLDNEGKENNRKLHCIIEWSYNYNKLNIEFNFVSDLTLIDSYPHEDNIMNNESIKNTIWFIGNDEDRKMTLLNMKENYEEINELVNDHLNRVNKMLKKEFPEVFYD